MSRNSQLPKAQSSNVSDFFSARTNMNDVYHADFLIHMFHLTKDGKVEADNLKKPPKPEKVASFLVICPRADKQAGVAKTFGHLSDLDWLTLEGLLICNKNSVHVDLYAWLLKMSSLLLS